MAELILETRALTRRFGALAAVDSVSLQVERGGVHAIIGPNGAGKSTLMNLLSGELLPTAGEVRLGGLDVTRLSSPARSKRGLGRSYQTANVFAELTCLEAVSLAAQSRVRQMGFFRIPAPSVAAAEVLASCGLAARSPVVAAQLSYGEQRQLELAMVLATDPTLLLLDEPLAGLGHDEAQQVVELLRRISLARTIVLVEHDMDAVFSIARTLTVLVNGRLLETGTPLEIRSSKAVRDAYLGEDEL